MRTFHRAQVALIDQTGEVSSSDLESIAAALNEDGETNFGPVWAARAVVTVSAPGQKPVRSWALKIQKSLSQPGALGYHTDQNNQPESLVELTDDVSGTLSHELKEMLADPYGNRMSHPTPPPAGADLEQLGLKEGDTVAYLVEVCDPPEAVSYVVADQKMSDFILPSWYDTTPTSEKFSFSGGCTQAQQVAEGGYCSFARDDDQWFQIFVENGAQQISPLGKFDKTSGLSLREWVDSKAREYRARRGS